MNTPLRTALLSLLLLANTLSPYLQAAPPNEADFRAKMNQQIADSFGSVTEEMIKQTPDWNPSQPLPKPVEELARLVIAAHVPSPSQPKTGWALESVSFSRVPIGTWPGIKSLDAEALKDKWFCQIKIGAYGNYEGDWWRNTALATLFLDGTLIPSSGENAAVFKTP